MGGHGSFDHQLGFYMDEFKIRTFRPGDEKAIEMITYRTGFKGEDLTNRGFFDDQRLFYLIFIAYYPRYEPQHCFVVESSYVQRVVGFICGTPDTQVQEVEYSRNMYWRILLRTVTYTTWRYPKTFLNLIRMSQIRPCIQPETFQEILNNYPAHLHINLLPELHRKGIGTSLIRHFENHLKEISITGVHLQTTNYNQKAVPFYGKHGYTLLADAPMNHLFLKDLRLLIFGKRL